MQKSLPTSTPAALAQLLHRLEPQADLVHRHLWLYDVLQWIRGDARDVQSAVGRVRQLLAQAQSAADFLPRWHVWWQSFISEVDVTPLLADFGFAARTAFLSEFGNRLQNKLIPSTPETTDMAQLFHLLLPHAFDAQWLRALEPALTQQLHDVFFHPPEHGVADDAAAATDSTLPMAVVAQRGAAGVGQVVEPHRFLQATNSYAWQVLHTTSTAWQQSALTVWQSALLDAILYNVSQINATGFANEIRVRMTHDAETVRAFHNLPAVLESFVRALHLHGVCNVEGVESQTRALREQLQSCRAAANTVYEHLDQHGVSVGIVFMLRQLRERIVRINDLLDALLSRQPAHATTRLLARLVIVGTDRRSLRQLWQSSAHLTAAKVAERSAEAGEQYITRTALDWRKMFLRGLGGGATVGFAVWFKFLLGMLGLSIFWFGFYAGVNYAIIFVLIYLLHWTVATKQPAVTAPAMAAKLKDMAQPNAIDAFVDEVTHLVRSQIAAIAGNMLGVVPAVLVICAGVWWYSDAPLIDAAYAHKTLQSLHLLGPTVLFAMLTGVLLFASSLIAGWVENWFVFHRLDSAIAWHPTFRRLLGKRRTQYWGAWWRTHISGLAANISLGMLLGLIPAFARFFGLDADVRHVTLAVGQVAAAAFTAGWDVWRSTDFWWAVAGVALVGPINLAVSFYLAFRTAVAAHNVPTVDRRRIRAALLYRLRQHPGTFFFPPATPKSKD